MDEAKKMWQSLKARSHEALGEEFWQDIANLLPNQGPKADLYQVGPQLVAVLELPGLVHTEQVKLSIKGKHLHVRGEIPCDYCPADEEDMLISERFVGKFQRKVALPQEVWPHSVRAGYKNGLLYVYMQKKPEEDEWPVQVDFVPSEREGGPHG